ncbi:hypothetical protein [Desulfurispora thermophila]|uniref:hypothetical protein n=1 Tax=Desulfurispora thermophila TaxID=265470 RepID=UPI00037CBB0E|nr:hypothetical protein [Desulfurispora thermophila]
MTVKAKFPSMPVIRKINSVLIWVLGIMVILGYAFTFAGMVLVGAGIMVIVTVVLLIYFGFRKYFIGKGWRLAKELGLKEYMIIPTNIEIPFLPPGRVYENHLQESILRGLKHFIKKVDLKERTAQMKQSYFDDYMKIAEYLRKQGGPAYIVGTTHSNMMKWWVAAFEAAGLKAIYLDKNIDPLAEKKMKGFAWKMAQFCATGRVRTKEPLGEWKTVIAVLEG